LKHVRQLDPFGCELAVAAMLSGRTYRQVKRAASCLGAAYQWDEAWGMPVDQFRQLLEAVTRAGWRIVAPARKPLVEYSRLPEEPAAVLIRPPGRRLGHWVVATECGRVIHDPELDGPRRLARYRFRCWFVIRVVRLG
jgi:hypothetical protein